jgi:hypothetical protein
MRAETFVRVELILVCVEITLYVYQLCVISHRASENWTLCVEITLVCVEIILVRVEITLLRVVIADLPFLALLVG